MDTTFFLNIIFKGFCITWFISLILYFSSDYESLIKVYDGHANIWNQSNYLVRINFSERLFEVKNYLMDTRYSWNSWNSLIHRNHELQNLCCQHLLLMIIWNRLMKRATKWWNLWTSGRIQWLEMNERTSIEV